MKIPASKKIAEQPAAVIEGLEFSERALGLCAQSDTTRAWLEKLDQAALHADAIQLLAAALPKRECVHWALVCAREALAKTGTPPQRAALDAAERWTKDPGDAQRRAAGATSETAKLDNAAGCTALAAYLSQGSLAPAGLTPVPPARHLCALSGSAAIRLAAQLEGPLHAAKHLRRFFELGLELAAKPAPWDAAPPPAPAPAPARAGGAKPR